MNEHRNILRIIISGGGTGGHIFPAISIADEIKERKPDAEILFVGALGKMEMDRVPAAGYKIIGLPVSGFKRRLTLQNIGVLVGLLKSIRQAKRIIRDFNPHIAIGVGGYASGPVLRSASKQGLPILLQEQNGYAGVTNKLLARRAEKICVAYPGMEKYFPHDKIILTGNPVRKLKVAPALKAEAIKHFGLQASKPVLLIIGGSLGARTINEAVHSSLSDFTANNVQVIWQTGKFYYDELTERSKTADKKLIQLHSFLARMDLAYNAADVVISRAGAITISELSLMGKAAILIPSPNVAEDHQTKNAMALVNAKAALMIKDNDAVKQLGKTAIGLLQDKKLLNELGTNCAKLAKPEATAHIVDEVFKIIDLN